jgi:hypothetical protein
MSRIMDSWEQTLRDVIDRDMDVRENALFQIGLVLERHSKPMEDGNYEGNLPRELMRIVLDEQRQADTVKYLVTLARNVPNQSTTVLYALCKAQPPILIQPLLELLREKGNALPSEAAYEALQGLNACLRVASEPIVAALKARNPREWISRWLENSDELLAEKAGFALSRLDALIPPPAPPVVAVAPTPPSEDES